MISLGLSRFIIGVLVIIGFFLVVAGVLMLPIKADVKDIILILIGALVGEFKNATGYFFSTSASSTVKDEVIKQAVAKAANSSDKTDQPKE